MRIAGGRSERPAPTNGIAVHRGEYKDSEKALTNQCVGQVLVPLVSLPPL
eukprot:SAG11_NODE_37204_length_258_cov_0.635220_1_plen_49_part_10